MFEELRLSCKSGGMGGFLPGMKQIANVAALPGIVGVNLINLFNAKDKTLHFSLKLFRNQLACQMFIPVTDLQ